MARNSPRCWLMIWRIGRVRCGETLTFCAPVSLRVWWASPRSVSWPARCRSGRSWPTAGSPRLLTRSPSRSASSTLSAWLAGLLAVSAVLGTRMAVRIVRALRLGNARALLRPLLTLASSGAVFVIGLVVVAADSPGVHASRHDGGLARVAALGWAATQSISTFWLHPHRLLALPAADLAWMVICPIAVAAAGSSLMRLVRLTGGLPGRACFSWQRWAFLPCLTGAAVWVFASQQAANPTFRAGTLDLLLVAVMAAACYAVRRDVPVHH